MNFSPSRGWRSNHGPNSGFGACSHKARECWTENNELIQVRIILVSIKHCDEYDATMGAINEMDEEKAK